jgi:hypothetical protein
MQRRRKYEAHSDVMTGALVDGLAPSELVLAAAFPAVLGICLVVWLDNAHLNTTNGMWKSIQVDQWKASFEAAPLDTSNYLYFPLMAALCRGLDLLGIYPEQTWRQMALINPLFAGVAVAAMYWMVLCLTGRRDIAVFGAIVHFGSAFFLSLAVSDEDIMPSYAFVLVAMAMAAVWFAAPTRRQVTAVAVAFTLGWLGEWRLMFPTLPPLILALGLSSGSIAERAKRIVLFLAAGLGIVLLVQICSRNHPGSASLLDVLWTGKGVDTGWAGFSVEKLEWVMYGMGEYWLGGHGPRKDIFRAEWIPAFAIELGLLSAASLLFLREFRNATMRNVGVIFLGNFAVGEFMNAYSQPADPQMQINVMPWFTAAAALLLSTATRGMRLNTRNAAIASAYGIFMLSVLYNVHVFAKARGLDSKAEAELRGLEQLTNPAQTVFVYRDWEGIVTWHFREWEQRWGGVCDLGPAPVGKPKFKWIPLYDPLIHHPSLSTDDYGAGVKAQFDCAFQKGYRVAVGSAWNFSVKDFERELSLIDRADLAASIYRMLHMYRNVPLGKPLPDANYELEELLER